MAIPNAEDFAEMLARQEAQAEATRPQRVAAWRESILPTFLEQWPPAVHALSVPSASVPLEAGFDVYTGAYGDNPERDGPRAVSAWAAAIMTASEQLHHRARGSEPFFRLGSRSPKDVWAGESGDPGGAQPRSASIPAIARAFAFSERVLEDLIDARDAQYAPQLWARTFIDGIEPHREFRCFMQAREIVGISVYRAWERHERVVEWPNRWEAPIRAWFPRFAEVAHVDDVVFDVVVTDDRVVLLELNPFTGSTYPGHFLDRPLDGRFRYLGDGDSKVVG
jgi:hypothetical protein